MNEEALKLYKKSLKIHGGVAKKSTHWKYHVGMPMQVVNSLCRAGYAIEDEDGYTGLDVAGIKQAVEDGSIWDIRNIGVKSIEHICDWLTR
jgi:hypothetical protein